MAQTLPVARPTSARRGMIRAPLAKGVYGTLSVVGFVAPFLLWAVVARYRLVGAIFLPPPHAVWLALVRWAQAHLLHDTEVSIYRVTMGFALGAVIGVPVGILIGVYKWCEALLQPVNDFVRYMPASAFIPLVILWVGIGEGSKIAIIFIGVVFQIVVMVADAVRAIPDTYIEAAYTMGATPGEVVNHVIWRGSWPRILDILRINMGWAWTYLVVAEMVAANSGLGFAILQAQRFLDTAKIFVGIFIIGLIGLSFDVFFRVLHRRLFPWYQR